MILNEIKCHINTSLGLVGGMYPLHHPCVRACVTGKICLNNEFLYIKSALRKSQ